MFAFVDKLSDSVGAPRPSEIHINMDLNASASFKGVLSGLVGGKTVLTLGLPLVSVMSLNSLAGVLAHEFGHFAQRRAMRLTYIVNRINNWFARIVYERDAWDELLAELIRDGDHWVIQLFAALARAMVWVSRQILYVLMLVAHLVSMLMARQMEYDADRHATRMVGASVSSETLRQLNLWAVAMNAAHRQISGVLAERRLPDNLPQLMANLMAEMPGDMREELIKAGGEARTGWFDTHPANGDRIKAMRRHNDEGVFSVEAPATALFTNFEVISKLLTQQYYRDNLGAMAEKVELVAVKAVEAERQTRVAQGTVLQGFGGGLVHPLRPVFLPDHQPEGDAERLADELFALRTQFAAAVGEAAKEAELWEDSEAKAFQVEQITAGTLAHLKTTDYRKVGLTSDDEATVRHRRQQLDAACETSRKKIDAALSILMLRMATAMKIEELSAAPPAPVEDTYDLVEPQSGGGDSLRLALQSMSAAADDIHRLRRMFGRQSYLASYFEKYGKSQAYIDAILSQSRKMQQLVMSIAGVTETAYPYTVSGGAMTLRQFLIPQQASANAVGDMLALAETLLDRYYGLYTRVMGDLAERCIAIESDLGLPPLELALPEKVAAKK